MPIKIDFLANVRDFLRGTRDIDEQLDDVADALDDVARDGDQATEKLERSFRDLAREARDTKGDVDKIGVDGSTNLRRLGDTGSEVSGELRQNLGETFSSFRGDLEDLPQIAQDTLGGLAGSGALGGIPGLVATAAGAAGLGLLIGAFQNIGAEQEALKEKTREWAEAYIESGGRVLSAATIVAKGQQVLTEDFDAAKRNAELWGVSVETAVAAMAGSSSAIDTVRGSVDGLRDAYDQSVDSGKRAYDEQGNLNAQLYTQEKAWRDAQGALDVVTGSMEAGAQQASIFSAFLVDMAQNTEGAKVKVDEFGDSVYELPDGTTIYVDAETGQATTDVDSIEKKVYGLPDGDVAVNATDHATAEVDRIIAANQGKTITVSMRARPGGGKF